MLRFRCLGARRDEIESDLGELYRERAAGRGAWYARLRYCADAASLWIHRAEPRPMVTASQSRGLDGLLLDLRFALRMFRRQARVVAVTVVGLALAIGVTSVVVGVTTVVVLPPPDSLGPEPASVVALGSITRDGRRLSASRLYPHYLRLRAAARLSGLEAYVREGAPFGDEGLEQVGVTLVSGGFFETLGVAAARGRVLTAADEGSAAAPVAVVNYTFWQRRLGGDPAIIGQTVRLMGAVFTVVGVIEEGFVGPTDGAEPPAFWAPLDSYEAVWRPGSEDERRVSVVGRIADGATRAQAEAEVVALDEAVRADVDADESSGRSSSRLVLAAPYDRWSDPATPWILAVITTLLGLVLVLACANVANLLLAGALTRRTEVGVRLSLGASRGRLVRQLLTESVMLGVAGGVLGLLFTILLLPIVLELLPLPATIEVAPDFRVFGFVVAATMLTGLLAGLGPARYGLRNDLAAPLKGDMPAADGSGRPGRARSVLIGTQAAASVVLLVLAALLTRSMVHVTQAEVGSDVDRLVTVAPRFGAAGYDAAQATEYWDRVLGRVAELPGIERAAVGTNPPFLGAGYRGFRAVREGRTYHADLALVSADYFATTGIPVLRGRSFTAAEVAGDLPVAIISERLARWLWEGEDAVGSTLERIDGDIRWDDVSQVRIIGIVADAQTRLDPLGSAALYRPLSPGEALQGNLVVRTRDEATQFVAPLLEAVRAVDPEVLPLAQTARDGASEAHLPLRIFATASAALGAIALALAIIGVYGVTAFAVEQRTGEIGVRLAIGAGTRDVMRLMLRDNLRPVAVGLIVGLMATIASSRVLTAVLFGISPHDSVSIVGAVVLLLGAAALAAVLPTRRVARIDPAVVLRRS